VKCTGKQPGTERGRTRKKNNTANKKRVSNTRYQNQRLAKKKKRRKKRQAGCLTCILIILCLASAGIYFFKQSSAKPEYLAEELEAAEYNKSLYREGSLYAEELCVASNDISSDQIERISGIHAAALFDMNNKEVDFSYNIHDRLYPASTTKILTALVAINQGNLDDMVTVSENASASSFAADEQICGLKTGDQLTLRDLLYGLILYSGNDNAVAIAEHIAGNMEAFADMMNEQAAALMATNSHFVNSNGLHNEDHYTTAYDLYLIFNECIKHQEFMDMISADSYTAHITEADGNTSEMKLAPTNYYASGEAPLPTGGTVIGGKTGTTSEAGNCLILLDRDKAENPYISIVMGADTKELLYQEMTAMIDSM